jgi:D-lactate dehydrogenase (cytochrome)
MNDALKFLAKDFSAIPESAQAAIWFEQESTSDSFDTILEAWNNLMQTHNVNEETAWFAFSDADKEKIKDFRHAISWKVNEYVARNNFRKLGTDVAVPDKFSVNFILLCKTGQSKAILILFLMVISETLTFT